jgi:hypothetical protein
MNLYTPSKGLNLGFDYYISLEATSELVKLQEVEARMNIDADSGEEGVIVAQIKAIRHHLERILGISLVSSQTITAYWGSFAESLPLPFGPVKSVTSVTLVNLSDGTETALTAGSSYWVEGVANKKIRFNTVYNTGTYGVKIVYVVGQSDSSIKALAADAILSEVLEWFHQRSNPDETQYTLGRIAMSKLHPLRKF